MDLQIILASRNQFYREGFGVIIKRLFNGYSIVQSDSIADTEKELNKGTANLVLLDQQISKSKSWESILINIHNKTPSLPICMVTNSQSNKADMKVAFELGVKGYLHQDSSPEEIKTTINNIVEGRVHFPETIWSSEKNHIEKCVLLTFRQREIMKYIEDGKSNKAIADSLNLSVATVKRHVSNIFKTLGVHNRVEAINTVRSILKKETVQ